MRIILRTETIVVEKRELEVNDTLCNEFNAYIKGMGHTDVEPITPDDVMLLEEGGFSRFDQLVKGYKDGEYEVSLEDHWREWIEDELWDCEADEIDRNCDFQEIYLAE